MLSLRDATGHEVVPSIAETATGAGKSAIFGKPFNGAASFRTRKLPLGNSFILRAIEARLRIPGPRVHNRRDSFDSISGLNPLINK